MKTTCHFNLVYLIKNDTLNKNNKLNINSDVICQFIYLYKSTKAVVRTVNCVYRSLTYDIFS